MDEDSVLPTVMKMHPELDMEILRLYADHYGMPWEKDPIRGGYNFAGRDLKFLEALSKLMRRKQDEARPRQP
jgi:hypothetical protein